MLFLFCFRFVFDLFLCNICIVIEVVLSMILFLSCTYSTCFILNFLFCLFSLLLDHMWFPFRTIHTMSLLLFLLFGLPFLSILSGMETKIDLFLFNYYLFLVVLSSNHHLIFIFRNSSIINYYLNIIKLPFGCYLTTIPLQITGKCTTWNTSRYRCSSV